MLTETPLEAGYERLVVDSGKELGVSEESLKDVMGDYIKKCLKEHAAFGEDDRDEAVKKKAKEYVCLMNRVTGILKRSQLGDSSTREIDESGPGVSISDDERGLVEIGLKLRYLEERDILDLYRKIPKKLMKNHSDLNIEGKEREVFSEVNKELTKRYGAEARYYARTLAKGAFGLLLLYLFVRFLILIGTV